MSIITTKQNLFCTVFSVCGGSGGEVSRASLYLIVNEEALHC